MRNNKTTLAILSGVIFTFVLFLFLLNGVQNKAIGLEEQIKTAESDIKIQEKRRMDLLYNLVDTVKEYDNHESETLKKIVEERGTEESTNLIVSAISESYPQLKSNENFKQLMTELSLTENLVAEHRSNYNFQVKDYNRYIKKFPNKQFLNILNYESVEKDYLNYDAPSDSPQDLFKNGNN